MTEEHEKELRSLRQRVLEQRREIAQLHAARDKAWEVDTIKVQYWRQSSYGGVVGRREQFVLRGRRVLGTVCSTGRFGPVMWLAAFGAGLAKNGHEAVAMIELHDTMAGAMKHHNHIMAAAGITATKTRIVGDIPPKETCEET